MTRGRHRRFLVKIDPRSRSWSTKTWQILSTTSSMAEHTKGYLFFISILQVASLGRAFQNFSKRFLRAMGRQSRFLVKIGPRSRSGENLENLKNPILNNGRKFKKSYLRQNATDIFEIWQAYVGWWSLASHRKLSGSDPDSGFDGHFNLTLKTPIWSSFLVITPQNINRYSSYFAGISRIPRYIIPQNFIRIRP